MPKRLLLAATLIALGLAVAVVPMAARQQPDDFPKPPDTEPETSGPMPAAEAAAAFRVPEGFRMSVFAAEPTVRNPIALTFDPRGRLWVAENYTYAERPVAYDLGLRDRVLILEDSDGDGKADRRTVFLDDVQRLTSVELGRGGAWLMCPPNLLFVPDRDGDDVPDGAAQVVLDGFHVPAENHHTVANGLKWGPDGWLYGRCGASSPGRIGAPGASDADRVPLNGGLWRYHPDRRTFEVLAHGTTNPWGHDWNALGEAFFINTVNGHLWHAVAGMHFRRPHSIDPNPHAYELIDQHADHYHWDDSKDWTDSRSASGEHDRRGGGHAHSGMVIYQGTNWPDEYRGRLFTLNLHGRRINSDRLEREGSGYVGRHEPDLAYAGDTWYRGIDLAAGPDGAVSILDWSDFGECHDSTGVHRSSGRIYRLSYGEPERAESVDLARLDARTLAELHASPDDWHVRTARRLLADRAARGEPIRPAVAVLREQLEHGADPVARLRALWTLHALGAVAPGTLIGLLADDHEAVRAWAIRLLADGWPIDDIFGRRPAGSEVSTPDPGTLEALVKLARRDESGLVRLVLASTLQRLPHRLRPALAAPLLRRAEDAGDHNLPLLIWYGLMPLGESDPATLAKLAGESELPTVRRLIARRLAESIAERPGPVNALIATLAEGELEPARLSDVLDGLAEGLRGLRNAPKPAGWEDLARELESGPDQALAERARNLGVVFGDGRALADVRRLALDGRADLETRRNALKTLIEARPPDLRATCESLLGTRDLNATAARGLALFDDPAIGKALASSYRAFREADRGAVLDTLASRPGFAEALLDAIEAGRIPKSDLGAFRARQVRSLGDPALTARLERVWGAVRETDEARRERIAQLKAALTPESLAGADKGRGRLAFEKACAACHRLYGRGGEVGPDLTGTGRHDLDYLLENLVDPGASVSADFRMTVVATADGRVLNGILASRNDRTLILRTQDETLVLPLDEVEDVRPSEASLMPEGLLDALDKAEVRDLIGYLMHPAQVALPNP